MVPLAQTPVPVAEEVGTTKQQIRRYWNTHPISTDSVTHAAGSLESFEAIYANWQRTTDAARMEFLEMCRGKRVLEIGCGIGKDARFLTENGIEYYGLDYSSRSVELATRHFSLLGLRRRFLNADAAALPFPDQSFDLVFSIGVLHHTPETARACRELVRITRPGGTVRVMLYNRASYHHALVNYAVAPLIRILLTFPFLAPLAKAGPPKLKALYEIAKRHGFDQRLLLAASADTASAGEENFSPHTSFHSESDMRRLFTGLEDFRFFRRDLKYFPLRFLRSFVESRWGFFLTMVARKPLAS